jgi:hypothetical protein
LPLTLDLVPDPRVSLSRPLRRLRLYRLYHPINDHLPHPPPSLLGTHVFHRLLKGSFNSRRLRNRRAFLTEASRGIFVHLLGFEHRPEVKEKLQQRVFDTKLLRKSLDLRCEIEPRDGYYEFTVEYDSEILNPTHNALDYSVQLDVDAAHKLEVLRMSFSSSDGKIAWNVDNPPAKQEEPGVDLVRGKKFPIEPEHKGIGYRASVKYRIRLFQGYSQFYTGVPTLHTRLRVMKIPSDHETSATKATVTNKDDWQYESIKMPGDHITLRWRKRGG